jgi:hypothetical protein
MQILTVDNQYFGLNNLPKEITEDIRYSVLDNSDPKDPDYFFMPLIYLESFSSPAVVLQIGQFQIQMPLEWSMLVGSPDSGELCVMPLTSLNDRGFEAFSFNPLKGFRPEWLNVDVINVYQDVKWYFPKLKSGQLLTTPLEQKFNPLCVYFVKEVSRQSEQLDWSLLW